MSWTYLQYKLRLNSPAIVATRSTVPFEIATQRFIPGSVIRGCMAARLLAKNPDGEDPLFRSLVLSGEVRYLNAYPRRHNARTLPMPFSWKYNQDDRRQATDLAYYPGQISPDDEVEDWNAIWPDERLTSPNHAFTGTSDSGGARSLIVPRVDARLHQQRDRAKGRPWKDRNENQHGAIFSCEYLEAEQEFHGVIAVLGKTAGELENMKTILRANVLLLGRSRRAGYGGEASIEFLPDSPSEWSDYVDDVITTDIPAQALFRVVLTSAYLGRDPLTGQRDPLALPDELEQRLGGGVVTVRQRWAFETVGGFNKKWCLELPQAQAVCAGSVVVMQASKALTKESMLQIQHDGIGERRAEGFGRLLFLKYDDKQKSMSFVFPEQQLELPAVAAGFDTLDSAHLKQITTLESSMILSAVRAELDRIAVRDLAETLKGHILKKSLLARLRTVFRTVFDEATAESALVRLHTWCGKEDATGVLKAPARKQLENCRIGTKNLREWLEGLSGRADDRWAALIGASYHINTLGTLAEHYCLTDEASVQNILDDHKAELTVYLIDAVFSALAQKAESGQAR